MPECRALADEVRLIRVPRSAEYRAACACAWRGPWREFAVHAAMDLDRHLDESAAARLVGVR